jgi:hypothetical protein
MDRRTFNCRALAAGAVGAAYVWIPKLAIAQVDVDAREAVIKARDVIRNQLGCLEEGSSTKVAKSGSVYSKPIKVAQAAMIDAGFKDFESEGTYFSKSGGNGSASFGAWHEDHFDHCNHYFHRKTRQPLVYITTVPYLIHSYLIEDARKLLSQASFVDAVYPDSETTRFDAMYGRPLNSPIILYCPTTVITFTGGPATHSPNRKSGVARVIVRKRTTQTVVYDKTWEYHVRT